MKIKRFFIILFTLHILSISLLSASAAEEEQSENISYTVYFDNSTLLLDNPKFYNYNVVYDMILLDGYNNIYYYTLDQPPNLNFRIEFYIFDEYYKSFVYNLEKQNGQIFKPTSTNEETKLINGTWRKFNLNDYTVPITEPSTSESTTEPTTEAPTTAPITDKQLDTLVYNSNLQTLIMLFALAISISVLVIIILYRFFQRFFYF